jgi:zinc and cadmium transporter
MSPIQLQWIYTLGSVAVVAGAALTGMLGLSFKPGQLARVVPLLVSLAAGALLGTAFGHLLPESIERVGAGRELSALLLGGFVTFFVLERVLGVWGEEDPGHSHLGELHGHGAVADGKRAASAGAQPMITNLLIGAGIHSFIDGMAIATAYFTGTNLGVITTIAVLFHETPHHLGDVTILIHKGVPIPRAVLLDLVAASAAVLGALLVLLAGTRITGMTSVLLPLTTANFIYIAAASLLPELKNERGQPFAQTLLFVAGCMFMFLASGVSER